jgi:hypothetical protein
MGIKHLIAIEDLMKGSGWFSRSEIRDTLQIDLTQLKKMLDYFILKNNIITKVDEKNIVRYKWKYAIT